MVVKKYITTNPGILSGKPVIAGTRIPIARILYLVKDGHTIAQIRDQYPHVSEETFKGVMDELAQHVDNASYDTRPETQTPLG